MRLLIALSILAFANQLSAQVGLSLDDKGRLRTRLLQVVAKQSGVWKIVSYHNVDVKPGVPVPEPR